jgi:hypothetical protein
MTVVRRRSGQSNAQTPALLGILTVFLVLVFYLATVTDEQPVGSAPSLDKRPSLRSTVVSKRKQLRAALDSLTAQHMPVRLYQLRETNEIVGERLSEIKAGTETVEELLHGMSEKSAKPPMELEEITAYLTEWIHTLHDALSEAKHSTYQAIWQSYHDLAVKTLYPWDREYLRRMPPRRDDGSIFLSLATYRDENCLNTVSQAYKKAKNPDKLFIGLVQQNCHANCMSGVLVGGKMEPVEPDQNCYEAFCETEDGRAHCKAGRVRLLDIDEPESLGPYAARYVLFSICRAIPKSVRCGALMSFLFSLSLFLQLLCLETVAWRTVVYANRRAHVVCTRLGCHFGANVEKGSLQKACLESLSSIRKYRL